MIVNRSILRMFAWCVVLGLGLGVLIAGCSGSYGSGEKTSDPPATKSSPEPKTMQGDPPSLSVSAQKGKKLFDSVGCMGCHTVNGQGGNVGPNLSNEGNSGHSDQWLATQIRSPKQNDPQTIMPAFDNLTNQQVNDLVDYLKSLKTADAPSSNDAPAAGPAAPRARVASAGSDASVSAGGKLWGKTCGQCHNLRAPSEYSDAQWTVAVHHMRVRVPLMGEEQRQILEFLQASN